jgi:GDPmannose 4,6-dehydratase
MKTTLYTLSLVLGSTLSTFATDLARSVGQNTNEPCTTDTTTVTEMVPRPLAVVKPKKAFITGITGQDGAYLTKFLLEKGYRVLGGHRRTSSTNFWRIQKLGCDKHPLLQLVDCDLTDQTSCQRVIQDHPDLDEVYNLAAQSFVGVSFTQPAATAHITGIGPVYLLESIRQVNRKIRYYQASTSELFGKVQAVPQSETTPFYPRSPYGVAKQYAHWMTINYRESYDMFACCGILFNHESPLRGEEFVSRKIALAVAKIKKGTQECLELGNLDSQRDWGFAGDYIKAMYLMLQQPTAQEYIIATGKTYTVRYFVEKAFERVGITLTWHGEGDNEYGVNNENGKTVVKVNPKFYRPAEVDLLIGDATKGERELGWKAEVTADQLINMMVDEEMK